MATAIDIIGQIHYDLRRGKKLSDALSRADGMDWDYLESKFGDGGRDKFWKSVIAEIRTALRP